MRSQCFSCIVYGGMVLAGSKYNAHHTLVASLLHAWALKLVCRHIVKMIPIRQCFWKIFVLRLG